MRSPQIPRISASLLAVGALAFAGCATGGSGTAAQFAIASTPSVCDLEAASPWIRQWFDAWELASVEILRLPDAPPPNVVFYDSACVYTTSALAGAGSARLSGPALRGTKLSWWATSHDDTLTLPNSSRIPVQLYSYTDNVRETGPFFVMAAPEYWKQAGHGQEPGLTGVFLHEFTHTRQLPGVADIIGPIDDAWTFPEELTDDAVQNRFGSDSTYVAAYIAERDLLYRAADADSVQAVRHLAAQALAMMQVRHAQWFVGDDAVFAILDATFLSMEGAAQWVAQAWLAHPEGGGLDPQPAIARMLGRRRWWSQDEGLALFLVVDRLLPEWPSLVFGERSIGALELLERAIQTER